MVDYRLPFILFHSIIYKEIRRQYNQNTDIKLFWFFCQVAVEDLLTKREEFEYTLFTSFYFMNFYGFLGKF